MHTLPIIHFSKLLKTACILSVVLFGSVAGIAKPFTIKGELTGTADYKYIYLFDQLGTDVFKKDSAKIENNTFLFKLADGTAIGQYQIGPSGINISPIVLMGENIIITANLANFSGTFQIKGEQAETKFLTEYNENTRQYYANLGNIDKEYQAARQQVADQNQLNELNTRIRAQLETLNNKYLEFYKTAAASKSTYIQKIALFFNSGEASSKLTFFKSSDFTDEVYCRGDFMQNKINYYFRNMVPLSAQNISSEFESVVALAPKNSKSREVVYHSLISIAAYFDQDYAANLSKQHVNEYPKSVYARRLFDSFPKPQPGEGEEAPDIALNSPNGKVIKLSSLRGKIVLLDFWASWCGPCRMENPNVVNMYNKYKDKGFTVYSVSLDGAKEPWVNAIKNDGLIWENHVSDLKKWSSSAAQLYRVSGIPATFLIGPDGKIIGKNLRGPDLERVLEQQFNK